MSASSTTARLFAGLLASGALVAAGVVPASAAQSHGAASHSRSAVVLGRIQYDAPGPDNRSNRTLNGEWVDVTNTSRHSVNLDGWTLSDRDGNRYRFDDLRLTGRSTVRVHTGRGHDTRRDVYQDRRDAIWGNNGDTATLRDDRGRLIDRDYWGRQR